MENLTLGQLLPNQTFCFNRDGKIYTFKSYTITNLRYASDAWHDSHYDYSDYSYTVDIHVEEQEQPLTITREDSTSTSYRNIQEVIQQEVLNLVVGYVDEGANTRYLHGNFEKYIVVWFDPRLNGLQYQLIDEWRDVKQLCTELRAQHLFCHWYERF